MKCFRGKYLILILSAYLLLGGGNISFYAAATPQGAQAASVHDGKYKERHANGRLKESGFYRNGLKDRNWFYYNEYGVMTHRERWKNGELQWQIFYEKGKISRIIDKDGKVTERPACGC